MKINQSKISRKQLMNAYDFSKATVLKLEKQGKLTPFYYDEARRKPYYDIKEIESAFEPAQ